MATLEGVAYRGPAVPAVGGTAHREAPAHFISTSGARGQLESSRGGSCRPVSPLAHRALRQPAPHTHSHRPNHAGCEQLVLHLCPAAPISISATKTTALCHTSVFTCLGQQPRSVLVIGINRFKQVQAARGAKSRGSTQAQPPRRADSCVLVACSPPGSLGKGQGTHIPKSHCVFLKLPHQHEGISPKFETGRSLALRG